MTLNAIITNVKKAVTANLLFAIFLTIITTFLIIRAMPENHIDWISANTILAARWWARDGFIKNYFLQLNPGYGKIVRYFEDPELNDHARGSVTGSTGHHRLYAAHYPNLHVVLPALMIKLGITKLFILRITSIIASILGLIFLYSFTKLLTNKPIALIGTVYFAVSPIFIKWADTLEYIPQEDMWRFLILMLSLIIFRYFNNKQDLIRKHRYSYLSVIWMSYFVLALISYNSTFFIFIWLVGLSAVYIHKNHNIKKKLILFITLALFWASAPILGFIIQLAQSIIYIGWRNAWLDISSAFTAGGNQVGLGLLIRLYALIKPFFSMTGIYNSYTLLVPLGVTKFKLFLVFLFLIAILLFIKLKKITGYKMPPTSILTLLAIAPLAQTLVLPYTGFRDNMGRLYAPFAGILIGSTLYMIFLPYIKKIKLSVANKIILGLLSIAIFLAFAVQVGLNFVPRFWSAYAPISDSDIAFTEDMKKAANGEKAVFMINADDTKIPEEELKKRWSLYEPKHYNTNYVIWEYYFDMPLLNFTKNFYLVRDLIYLEKRSEFPFTAIVTSDDTNLINEIYKNLMKKKLFLSQIKTLENRYYFVVSPILKKDFLPNIGPAPTAPDT